MPFEVSSRRQWALVCTDCGVAYEGRWRRFEQETAKDLKYAEKYGCRNCRDKAIVAALPEHHAHKEEHPSWNGSWPCCGAHQLGLIAPNLCQSCGEPYPCSTAKLEDRKIDAQG